MQISEHPKGKAWHALAKHQMEMANKSMLSLFQNDTQRFSQFSLQCDQLLVDFSRHCITDHTLALLKDLATERHLIKRIQDLFSGSAINFSEKRPALHTALRDKHQQEIIINDENIVPAIQETQIKMRRMMSQIHKQEWRGVTGKPIKHIVNIGIGGSYAGPLLGVRALREFAVAPLKFHFISTVDLSALFDVLDDIDPETTLFIVASKSFTTLETLSNAETIRNWLQQKLATTSLSQHFIAITAATEKARAFGVADEHILPLWDWVGGRYSLWSSMGLPLLLMIGEQNYDDFLDGAHRLDQHFRSVPIEKNIPIILGLLDYWYTQFVGTQAQAIIPYMDRLRLLVPYLQQTIMESNGKSVNVHGDLVDYTTCPVIIGEEGCRGQHAYHQLLHQGTQIIPADFILIGKSLRNEYPDHHAILLASALSQAEALMRGKNREQAYAALIAANYSENEAKLLAAQQIIPGNRPSTLIYFEYLTPRNLGTLLALYEHRVFVQGVLSNINSFDQWGVELGKQLLPDILKKINHSDSSYEVGCTISPFIQKIKA